eukprot:jgi/Ulvmu1/2587/UM014_0038.1
MHKQWRRICERASFHGVGLALLLTLLCSCLERGAALSAHKCRDALVTVTRQDKAYRKSNAPCGDPICGEIPPSPLNFTERLSPQCSALFDSYRSSWSRMHLSNTVKPGDRLCSHSILARSPTNPVLMSAPNTATFLLCSVPKVGCTNLRKLLYAMLQESDAPIRDAFTQFNSVHLPPYPTIWHYKLPHPDPRNALTPADFEGNINTTAPEPFAPGVPSAPPRVPSSIPSFVVGRNPYVRLVSGYLDKMVYNPQRYDQWTFKSVNRGMGFAEQARWNGTVASFRNFVRSLAHSGIDAVDGHFHEATKFCAGSVRMDYYLKLEELEEWFPCFMDGLGLRRWTETGWADTPHGRMRVGEGEQRISIDAARGPGFRGAEGVDWMRVQGDQCWWSPSGMSCKEYYDSFVTEDGTIVPAGGRDSAVTGALRDEHDTRADEKWQQYYDQETSDLVFFLYYSDFQAFGYPRFIAPQGRR